jgi:LysM repeat protein
MNSENPYRDQAERLRKRIEKMNESTNDDSSLPPRSDLHRLKKKKTKWKIKYPIIRLLVLFFILLPITIFSIYSYREGKKPIISEKASVSSKGFETIDFEKPKKAKAKQLDKDLQTNDGKIESKQQNENKLNHTTNENTETETLNSETGDQKVGTTKPTGSSNIETNGQETSTSKNSNPDKIVYHTVQPQETLYRIAMNYFHSNAGIEIIKQANHIQNNNIVTGQVLKIPLKK